MNPGRPGLNKAWATTGTGGLPDDLHRRRRRPARRTPQLHPHLRSRPAGRCLLVHHHVRPAHFYLVGNPIGRYSIGDRTPGLRRAADGSLTIVIQHDQPADTSNWLPAPANVEGLAAEYLHAVLPAEEKGTVSSAKMTRVIP